MKIMETHENSNLDYFRCTFTDMLNISLVLKRFCEMHNFSDVGLSANCDAFLRLLKSQLEGKLQWFFIEFPKI